MNVVQIFLGLAIVLVVILTALSIRIIRPYEKGLVERLGKFQKTLDPGLRLIFPVIDTVMKVDMREVVIDLRDQMLEHYQKTCDNVPKKTDSRIGPFDLKLYAKVALTARKLKRKTKKSNKAKTQNRGE